MRIEPVGRSCAKRKWTHNTVWRDIADDAPETHPVLSVSLVPISSRSKLAQQLNPYIDTVNDDTYVKKAFKLAFLSFFYSDFFFNFNFPVFFVSLYVLSGVHY